MEALEVCHHRAHHTARKAATDKKRAHVGVVRIDPVAEEVVYELLSQRADFHVGIHVQVLDLEAVGFQHFADRDHIRMNLTP